ncbi:MAG: aldo/keto reductase [Oscillospiraceae bacterium]|nr:aldo/keto reductase [Oscillospiraceae bacterium]
MAYLGENTPKLGFGLMRLPMIERDIDENQTKDMVDIFMENGFTYFDTAYGYNGGKSEEMAKIAIVDRYPRDSFTLATKLPAWAGANNAEEAKQMFHTSMARTGVEYFDYYLLHNISATRIKSFDDYGIWDYVLELKEQGLIKHVGFSYHDRAELLDEILTKHPEMEFVQLQINYGDWENGTVQSRLNYETVRKHGKPVVIMEPIKGGLLANPAPSIRAVFEEADPNLSCASWAIRFAASLEGVITVLSGMSTLEQMTDNVSYMKNFAPLNEQEQGVILKAQEALTNLQSVPCTACEYCVADCPENIAIPTIFEMMNREMIYGDARSARFGYSFEVGERKASKCIECGLCEEVCPQEIKVRDMLKIAVEKYETEMPGGAPGGPGGPPR